MQVIISKTLFVRAARFNKKLEVLSRLLKTLDVKEVKETSWDEIVSKIQAEGGTLTKGGMSITYVEAYKGSPDPRVQDQLIIDFDDEAIVGGMDIYEEFLGDLVPVVLGFVTSLKSICRVFETRLKALQKRWDTEVEGSQVQ